MRVARVAGVAVGHARVRTELWRGPTRRASCMFRLRASCCAGPRRDARGLPHPATIGTACRAVAGVAVVRARAYRAVAWANASRFACISSSCCVRGAAAVRFFAHHRYVHACRGRRRGLRARAYRAVAWANASCVACSVVMRRAWHGPVACRVSSRRLTLPHLASPRQFLLCITNVRHALLTVTTSCGSVLTTHKQAVRQHAPPERLRCICGRRVLVCAEGGVPLGGAQG